MKERLLKTGSIILFIICCFLWLFIICLPYIIIGLVVGCLDLTIGSIIYFIIWIINGKSNFMYIGDYYWTKIWDLLWKISPIEYFI